MRLHNFYTAKILATRNDNSEPMIIVATLPDTFAFDIASQYEAPFAQGLGGEGKIASMLRLGGLSLTNQAMTAQVWQGTSDVQFTIPFVFQADTNEIEDVIKPIKNLLKLTLPRVGKTGGLLESPGPRIDLQKLVSYMEKNPGAVMNFPKALGNAALEGAGSAIQAGASFTPWGDESGLQGAISKAGNVRGEVDSASAAFSAALNASITNNIRLEVGHYIHFPHVVVLDVQQTANVQPMASGVFQRVEVNVTFKTFLLPTANDLDNMFQVPDH